MNKNIWYKVLLSLTRGVDMRVVLIQASCLAFLSCFFTTPHFYYMIFGISRGVIRESYSNQWMLLFTQLFLLLTVSFLSALVGLTFTKRYELPQFWDPETFFHSIPLLVFLGLGMIIISYLIFDRQFVRISPDSYPQELLYLLSLPFKNAFTDEIILRFCFLTICIGVLKNRIVSVVIVSIVATLFPIKYFHFMGIDFTGFFIPHFFLSLIVNLILGYIYITRGMICTMFLKFIYSLKYIIIVLKF